MSRGFFPIRKRRRFRTCRISIDDTDLIVKEIEAKREADKERNHQLQKELKQTTIIKRKDSRERTVAVILVTGNLPLLFEIMRMEDWLSQRQLAQLLKVDRVKLKKIR